MFIVGIEPKAPGLHIFSKVYIPRLGLPQLLTIAREKGHNCEIYCEELTAIPWDRVAQADMVLISSLTSTVPRAYQFVRKIKEEIDSKIPVLLGGPHVTFLPEEALDNGVDYVFRNEGDESFPQFLEWWMAHSDHRELFDIPGLSFKMGDKYYHTPPAPRVDLNTLPTPDLDLIYGYEKPSSIPLITSRGCPWRCEFCSEVPMFGGCYRFRSEDKVIEDIRYYDRRYGKIPIFIAEDNFGANKPRLERLCRSIVDSKLVRPLDGQVRLDLAKHPQTLKLMTRAGFDRAYIGYESTNPDSLKSAGKGITPEKMEDYTKTFHKQGIAIHSMWILGFDDDTLETVRDTIRSCIKWKIETAQFLVLVPIPGSPLYERFKKENRIFNRDWSKYDGHHVTFYPKGMTARQLQIAVILDAMPRIYGLGQTFKIFVSNNIRIGMGLLKFRRWHPFRDLKGNILTLVVRIWGKGATRKMRKPIREYIKQIPMVGEKARAQG
jgi:anaerobic magnesium-protoporphyrin IX monomethyl ester cyclase